MTKDQKGKVLLQPWISFWVTNWSDWVLWECPWTRPCIESYNDTCEAMSCMSCHGICQEEHVQPTLKLLQIIRKWTSKHFFYKILSTVGRRILYLAGKCFQQKDRTLLTQKTEVVIVFYSLNSLLKKKKIIIRHTSPLAIVPCRFFCLSDCGGVSARAKCDLQVTVFPGNLVWQAKDSPKIMRIFQTAVPDLRKSLVCLINIE